MQIVRATPEDAQTLTEIAFAAKRHRGYDERRMAGWSSALTIGPRYIAEHDTYALLVDDQTAGCYALICRPQAAVLDHFWIRPGMMRRGLGRVLLAHALERARELGCEQLEVESDPNAAGFYARLGGRCVAAAVSRLDGQRRELPIFVFDLKQKLAVRTR